MPDTTPFIWHENGWVPFWGDVGMPMYDIVKWLALGAGLAGGADAILIPEIPYTIDRLAESILEEGQQAPILVRKDEGRLVLVEGLHRVRQLFRL